MAPHALGQPHRVVAPLVAEDQVHVAQGQGGQGLLWLAGDQLAAQPRRLTREPPHRGQRDPQRDRLEPGDPPPPRHAARGRGQVGLGERGALEQGVGVVDQDERRVGEAHAAPHALQQGHTRLPLQHRELLRDSRGRELEGVGDRGDRAALVQLAQQTQTSELEHCEAMLLNYGYESESLLIG